MPRPPPRSWAAASAATVDEALAGADAAIICASTDDHPGLIRAAIEPRPADLLREAAGGQPRRVHRRARATSRPPACPSSWASSDASTRPTWRPGASSRSGAIGDIHLLSLRSHDPEPASEEFIASSGGMFRDLSIHDLDILRFLSGREVDEVYVIGSAKGFPLYEKYDDLANAVAVMRLDRRHAGGAQLGTPRPPRPRRAHGGLRLA